MDKTNLLRRYIKIVLGRPSTTMEKTSNNSYEFLLVKKMLMKLWASKTHSDVATEKEDI